MLLNFVTKFNNIHSSIPDILINVDENKVNDQYNVLLHYYLIFILKKNKNVDKNIWSSNHQKNKNIQPGQKKGVLIKKKVYLKKIL